VLTVGLIWRLATRVNLIDGSASRGSSYSFVLAGHSRGHLLLHPVSLHLSGVLLLLH
jgi:hypothetical protein